MNRPKGIREGSSKKAMPSIAQLKCLYTKAYSTGNKQEELEIMAQLEKYDLITIMETWWDESYNWNTAIKSYKLFRRGKEEQGCCALY